MPVVGPSTFRPRFPLGGPHVQTLLPAIFRKVRDVHYERERITLPDGDFLNLDWSRAKTTSPTHRLVLISHGMEGSTDRHYVRGMARAFNRRGWDALAWNFRTCGGEMNLLPRSYHSGVSDDLGLVVARALKEKQYKEIALVGFSMGGNITLKYLGEKGARLSRRIKSAVVFSVPCDLTSSAEKLAAPSNRIYMRQFLKELQVKMRAKHARFPELFNLEGMEDMRSFREFDDRFTGPIHGFKGALDYWGSCASVKFVHRIRIPTLLVNAADDPFLTPACSPIEIARDSSYFHVELPERGGHVGFIHAQALRDVGGGPLWWTERRALDFIGA